MYGAHEAPLRARKTETVLLMLKNGEPHRRNNATATTATQQRGACAAAKQRRQDAPRILDPRGVVRRTGGWWLGEAMHTVGKRTKYCNLWASRIGAMSFTLMTLTYEEI
ncbi:hypothetical protein RP20_CCG016405 [Aedes albopictus]|nr:hypothetical protein RP20_CCG016405 [Aedes albopictus]